MALNVAPLTGRIMMRTEKLRTSEAKGTCALPNHSDDARDRPNIGSRVLRPAALGLLLVAVGAPGEAASAADLSSDEEVLPTIVVTATKRPANVRDVPGSIEVRGTEELEEAGLVNLRDILVGMPGVSLTELQQDQYRISIRGIQLDSGGNVPAEAGVFIDDVPLNDPFLNQPRPDLLLFDLHQVELLKGPQGTLFGGSALSGALRYTLADADPSGFLTKTYVEYGDVKEGSSNKAVGAAVNLPVGRGDAALRLTANRRLEGGTIDDLRNDVDDTNEVGTTAVRGIFRWDATDDTTLRLKALRQETHADDVPFSESLSGDLERSRALRSGSPSDSEFTLYAVTLNSHTSIGEATSITSHVRKHSEFANAFGERAFGIEDDGDPYSIPTAADVKQVTQEVRLRSTDAAGAPWSWLVGAFFQDYHSDTTQQVVLEPAGTDDIVELLDFVADVDAQERALFGELTYRVGNWETTLGLRAYSIETEGEVVTSGVFVPDPGINRNDANLEKEGLNPKLAFRYLLSTDVSFYAAIARGFRFGGIQITGPSDAAPDAPTTYSPDSLWSYEIGTRTQWLNGRLQADGAIFYIDWNKPQVQTNTGGDVPLNVTDNVGGARSYGAELALRWLPPVKGLSMSLTGGYTNAKTTKDFLSPFGTTVEDGTRLPGYADIQATAQVRYVHEVPRGKLEWMLEHREIGEGEAELAGPYKIYDYHTTDARIRFQPRRASMLPHLSVGVLNLTDERARVAATFFGPDNFTAIYNIPRTVVVRAGLDF